MMKEVAGSLMLPKTNKNVESPIFPTRSKRFYFIIDFNDKTNNLICS